ncbi:MAG: SIS domain-containing protein [Phycisphaerae bacterium]|nr:SIS domain-containing protein [Phycisphaerae bacterium]
MSTELSKRFDEAAEAIRAIPLHLEGSIAHAADILTEAVRQRRGIFLFGNGGSACDAQHIAAEFVGRFAMERHGFRAEALNADSAVLTALGNDYGYEAVFARQLEAKAAARDVAVALSTSGDSANVVTGLSKAREMQMTTIALTGRRGGKCAEFADVLLNVPADTTAHVQQGHVAIYHVLCEWVEQAVAT